MRTLPPLGVITQHHPATPAVGLGVGDGAVEQRTLARAAMKLHTGHQRQSGLDREAIRCGQPIRVVLESSTVACALRVETQRTQRARAVTEQYVDGAFHSGDRKSVV